MKTILLQSEALKDIELLLAFAQRLGIQCFEVDDNLDLSAANPLTHAPSTQAEVSDSSLLYAGLGLNEEISVNDYGTFINKSQVPSTAGNFNAKGLSEALSEVGGAWENDKEETLEDILNMLTP
ncbi:MAG: hypothetical protein HC913_05010 [Microscillaceae bacterium]|nr:hypothetical protein [Microscillaceae bacterium]